MTSTSHQENVKNNEHIYQVNVRANLKRMLIAIEYNYKNHFSRACLIEAINYSDDDWVINFDFSNHMTNDKEKSFDESIYEGNQVVVIINDSKSRQ